MRSKADHAFSRQWYERMGRDGVTTTWMGVCAVKNPLDMWLYQEIIWQTKPELIVETGAFAGGSALYMAHVLDALWERVGTAGEVVSIDIATDRELPQHVRLEFLLGLSSTAPEVLEVVRKRARGRRTMVVLDSDHAKAHVLRELDLYAPFVSRGCYLIVEDTNRDGYHLGGGYDGEGPAEALKAWQPTNKGFRADHDCERLGMTQNPGGYLCRVR